VQHIKIYLPCNFEVNPITHFERLCKLNWSKGRTARHIFGREPFNDYFIKILFLLSKWFQTKRFLWEFSIGSYVKLSSAVKRGDEIKKNLLLWNYRANLNQTLLKWFLGGPLPKLCSAFQKTDQDGPQFWKRTTQESFQQSLVEIGSVVSEEKIFFNFIPPFF
jgi:hypothetical protein